METPSSSGRDVTSHVRRSDSIVARLASFKERLERCVLSLWFSCFNLAFCALPWLNHSVFTIGVSCHCVRTPLGLRQKSCSSLCQRKLGSYGAELQDATVPSPPALHIAVKTTSVKRTINEILDNKENNEPDLHIEQETDDAAGTDRASVSGDGSPGHCAHAPSFAQHVGTQVEKAWATKGFQVRLMSIQVNAATNTPKKSSLDNIVHNHFPNADDENIYMSSDSDENILHDTSSDFVASSSDRSSRTLVS
ncbi:hypothetical protein Pcinc_036431 [Petrolisthes cinctipes]|uniref:Uncharacterized protein n=1 Tax=Petrolisthes cinctipes TaxID=88211 RepID=A0AAE1BVP8_PETCI|nr:hypothetical protein Pcinc_036431 [Petrolisthes cinctipes]